MSARAAPAAPAAPARRSDPPSRELRVQVRPRWPLRLPRRGGMDGLTQVRRGVLHRLLHDREGRPVRVRVAQLSSGDVVIGAEGFDAPAAEAAIAAIRRALGVDLDLRPFHRAFRADPLIGPAVRAHPTLRPAGRAQPFEALAWAITEQLIEFERAVGIQRRLVSALGRRDGAAGLRDSPSAEALARAAPALLESCGLSGSRALALVRAAREVARGRVRLAGDDPAEQESGWRRLQLIPGIGRWTVEMLALVGQGRLDQVPAGDLAFLKLVGRLRSGGDPRARGSEQDVRELFAPYGEWKGLAGVYALRALGLAKSPIAAPA